MTRKKYQHSAYYYAYRYGWTHSEAQTYAEAYLDFHTYRPRMRKGSDGEWSSKEWFKRRNSAKTCDYNFKPLAFLTHVAVDIGIAMRNEVRRLSDPAERDRMKRELMQDLRRVRRPFYYAQEVERRRRLAIARRKINRRRTTAPMPTPKEVLEAWNERKSSREAMIRLGGMLHDLECYVDNCLRIDGDGRVVGRNHGIRGWIAENIPELLPKYKTLMRYKAMVIKLRQATDTRDPKPTNRLLRKPYHSVVNEILCDERLTFASIIDVLDKHLSPDRIFDG